jgi:tyrosyl-tRNA synthetase
MKSNIKTILQRGVEKIVDEKHLEKLLSKKTRLNIKLGIDPTASTIHLGHMVVLRKLKQFQDVGHNIHFVIGDFTASVGDPSGRDKTRPVLTKEEIKNNFKKYISLSGKILSISKTKVHNNSSWFKKGGIELLMNLSRAGSIQQVLRRADFKKRLDKGLDITMAEMLYPLLQGYDSVEIKADVEIGGTDQIFNLLMGRRVQRFFDMKEQDVMTLSLLEGTDGDLKMSKSFGNYISIDEDADQMFAKIMKIPDRLIEKYFVLLTDISDEEIKNDTKKLSLFDWKKKLGISIVSTLHSKKAASDAQIAFEKIFSKKEDPNNAKKVKFVKNETWVDFLIRTGVANSKTDARRLINGGGVGVGDNKVEKASEIVSKKGIIKVGKHRFFEIV